MAAAPNAMQRNCAETGPLALILMDLVADAPLDTLAKRATAGRLAHQTLSFAPEIMLGRHAVASVSHIGRDPNALQLQADSATTVASRML